MMLLWLTFLCIVLFFSLDKREGLTIEIDTDTIHKYTVLPIYRTFLSFIPFKYHYRKLRQYFKSS